MSEGWSLKDIENKVFRENALNYLNCDVFCITETFLKYNETNVIEGYKFFSHNRSILHKEAKRGSGGVCIFVSMTLLSMYEVSVLDDSVEYILWL